MAAAITVSWRCRGSAVTDAAAAAAEGKEIDKRRDVPPCRAGVNFSAAEAVLLLRRWLLLCGDS